MALGAFEVNLLELTSAYGTLAAQGEHVEPHGIVLVRDRYGKVLYSASFKPKRVLDKDSAAIMTWMLRDVIDYGTGQPAQLGREAAGKTGTSENYRDLWFVGYIPQLVAGIWLGNDNNSPTYGSSGTAAYTWHQFMNRVVQGMPVQQFPPLPRLEGRKGTIKAKPIKPKRVYEPAPPAESTYDNTNNYDNNYNSNYDRPSEGYSSSNSGSYSGRSSEQSNPAPQAPAVSAPVSREAEDLAEPAPAEPSAAPSEPAAPEPAPIEVPSAPVQSAPTPGSSKFESLQ
jgi:penicillin-binding protein 1A